MGESRLLAARNTMVNSSSRKICANCKCDRESHDLCQDDWVNVRDRLGFTGVLEPDKRVSKDRAFQQGYSWVPPALSREKIEEYMSQLPNHKVPRLGTAGEKYRERNLVHQLPAQDLALTHCRHVAADHQRAFRDFVQARNDIALDVGFVRELNHSSECRKCQGVIRHGELAVIAPRFGDVSMLAGSAMASLLREWPDCLPSPGRIQTDQFRRGRRLLKKHVDVIRTGPLCGDGTLPEKISYPPHGWM